jgi:hypothetical protein
MSVKTTCFTPKKSANEQKRPQFDKKQNKTLYTAPKAKQIRGKNIRMVENAVKYMRSDEIAREYWKLGLYLLDHSKVKLGIQYLDASIHYKKGNGQCCHHEEGVYNKLIDKHFNEKR